jgi:tryptophan halogenase
LKKGIKFTNWNGDNKHYFHSINEPLYKQDFVGDYFVARWALSQNNDIPLHDSLIELPIHIYTNGIFATNQYHFNTFKLNDFMLQQCTIRGINIVDSTINDIVLDENGNIVSLKSETGNEYKADFYIDSTGMKRVLSSKLGCEWVSYQKYLPMNHAIAFPTSNKEVLNPWTESNALSSGWNWNIPTQGRDGNGYVFCDAFCDKDKAYEEICSYYNEPINVAKDISFDPGRLDKFWEKNCVSVGLSGSFVEPLEASSIGFSIIQTFGIINMIEYWQVDPEIAAKKYNELFINSFDNIVDFVQLHYFTKRNDSEFWKASQSIITKTPFNEETLDIFKNQMPSWVYFTDAFTMFKQQNWIQVLAGIGLVNKQEIAKTFYNNYSQNQIESNVISVLQHNAMIRAKDAYIEHAELLKQNKIYVN